MSLLVIYGANPKKVSRFSETLWSSVQALETIGKLGEVNGYVRMVLNKLEGIRFSDNRRWLARIEIRSACRCVAKVDCKEPLDNRKKAQPRKTDTTQTIETQNVPRQSKSRKEDLVSTAPDTEPINQSTGIKSPQSKNACRKQLNLKQLCFIVLERTTEPRSVAALPLTFKFCKRRHHSSIWERTPRNLGTWWWLLEEAWPGVSYRLVVVCVGGIQCRTPQSLPLILGTNEHYLTEDDLYERIVGESKWWCRQATTKEIEIHEVIIKSLSSEFQFQMDVTNVNSGVLTHLGEPKIHDMVSQYQHVPEGRSNGWSWIGGGATSALTLGTNEYAQVKTETTPKIGEPGEPLQN